MLVDCILIFVYVFVVVVFILSVRAKWLVDKVCSFVPVEKLAGKIVSEVITSIMCWMGRQLAVSVCADVGTVCGTGVWNLWQQRR